MSRSLSVSAAKKEKSKLQSGHGAPRAVSAPAAADAAHAPAAPAPDDEAGLDAIIHGAPGTAIVMHAAGVASPARSGSPDSGGGGGGREGDTEEVEDSPAAAAGAKKSAAKAAAKGGGALSGSSGASSEDDSGGSEGAVACKQATGASPAVADACGTGAHGWVASVLECASTCTEVAHAHAGQRARAHAHMRHMHGPSTRCPQPPHPRWQEERPRIRPEEPGELVTDNSMATGVPRRFMHALARAMNALVHLLAMHLRRNDPP
jgi:hypothetical protein